MTEVKLRMKHHILTTILWLTAFSAIGQTIPKVDRQDVDNCTITKIETNTYATTVYFKYTSEGKYTNGGWACAEKDFFLEDTQTGKRFKMLKANNIPICPDKHEFTGIGQELNFSIDFEPINNVTDKINVIENELESAFNFYGVEVSQTDQAFFSVKSTTVYLIVALLMTFFVNLFFRKRFSWWVLLLITAIPNFLIGILVIYVIALMQYEKVFLNFNEQNVAGQFGESLGNTLIAFLFIAPFFRRKKQTLSTSDNTISKKENKLNPLNQFKKLPQGAYRLIIAGWIIIPIAASAIAAGISRNSDDAFLATLIFSIPIYYLLARLGAWVFLGFKIDKPVTDNPNEIPAEKQEVSLTAAPSVEIVNTGEETKPNSFYFSIILTIFLFIAFAFIGVLFNQISNYRIASNESNEKIKILNENIKSEQSKYQIYSLVGSKTASEECTIDYELTVENQLNIPIRLYISQPINANSTIKWEPFADSFWLLEPGYSGKLITSDNKTLTVAGYRYFITDTDGNFIIGSPKRPVYTSIMDNILQGLKIY